MCILIITEIYKLQKLWFNARFFFFNMIPAILGFYSKHIDIINLIMR